MEDAYYLEVYVPMSSKWTIAYIKKAGITEDNRHAEISTTFPHQAATPKQQMLKWRHHSTKWSTQSNADDRLHQRRDKTGQLTVYKQRIQSGYPGLSMASFVATGLCWLLSFVKYYMIVFFMATELYICVVISCVWFVIGNECIYVVNEREKGKEITPWDYVMW